jgi:hypothetical protein
MLFGRGETGSRLFLIAEGRVRLAVMTDEGRELSFRHAVAGDILGERIPLELGFSQSELAQLLGASRPKVNAAMGLLESADAIKRTIDRIFCDPEKLARLAKGNDA